jgi:N-acetylmuramoyl-L-alanine amidase
MPTIYLSPSTQENNYFVNGGTEEQYMNLIADAMVPCLEASGIQYVRNTPSMTAASSIAASNAGSYDLHLALHSNAAPEGQYGTARGCLVFYYPGSVWGAKAAEIIADNLRAIYPLPNLVRTVPTASIGEVSRTRAPSVFIEFAYHDNPDDAAWIKNNIQAIARNVVLSLTEYFGIPFFCSSSPQAAVVDTDGSPLNIRTRPNTGAPILAKAYDGARLTVLNRWNGWCLVQFGRVTGYASGDYLTLL